MLNAMNKISLQTVEKYFYNRINAHGITLPHRKPL